MVAKAEGKRLQRLAELGVDLGRPAGAPGIEQRGDAGAPGQTPHLAAPAAENAAGDTGLGRRSGVGIAARDAERNQALGAADGGKPSTRLVAFILPGPLPRRLVGQKRARFLAIEGAGLGIIDSALALAGCGPCIGGAGPLLGCFIGTA